VAVLSQGHMIDPDPAGAALPVGEMVKRGPVAGIPGPVSDTYLHLPCREPGMNSGSA